MSVFLRRALTLAFCALALAGCVFSDAPILADSKPLFGPTLNLQFFTLRDGVAKDPVQARFVWDGAHYAPSGSNKDDLGAFTLHAFEGSELIAQSVPDARQSRVEYALVRKFTDGVFLLVPIDIDDADAATRAKHCPDTRYSCRIATREQLVDFARASAAHPKDKGALVIRLADDADK